MQEAFLSGQGLGAVGGLRVGGGRGLATGLRTGVRAGGFWGVRGGEGRTGGFWGARGFGGARGVDREGVVARMGTAGISSPQPTPA